MPRSEKHQSADGGGGGGSGSGKGKEKKARKDIVVAATEAPPAEKGTETAAPTREDGREEAAANLEASAVLETSFDPFRDLLAYYTAKFPYPDVGAWLNYGNMQPALGMRHREFAFEMQKRNGATFFVRFQQFGSTESLKQHMNRLSTSQESCPVRVNIGPLYRAGPEQVVLKESKDNVLGNRPLYTELRFDVDFGDQLFVPEDATSPASGQPFRVAWLVSKVQQHVVHEILKKDYSFKCMLWVFSGRRGWHLWVCDKRVVHAAQEVRSAVFNYLNLDWSRLLTREARLANGSDPLDHPLLHRVYELVKASPCFHELIETLPLFRGPDAGKHFERLLPFSTIRHFDLDGLHGQLVLDFAGNNQVQRGEDQWKFFELKVYEFVQATIQEIQGNRRPLRPENEKAVQQETAMMVRVAAARVGYPVFDRSITTSLNHLLRLPFSVHNKTGYVATPLKSSAFGSPGVPRFVHVKEAVADAAVMGASLSVFRNEFLRSFREEYGLVAPEDAAEI